MSIDGTAGGRARLNPLALARNAFAAWRVRSRELHALAAMDDRALKDIGLSRYDAQTEAARWRWRA